MTTRPASQDPSNAAKDGTVSGSTIFGAAATPMERIERLFSVASIRTRLILILIAFAILPVAISASVATILQNRSSRENTTNSLTAIATIKTTQIEEWIGGLQNNLQNELSRDADTLRMRTILSAAADTPLIQAAYETQLNVFQNAAQAANSPFEEIFMLNLEGDVILSTSPQQEGKNFALQPFFKNGLRGPYLQGASFNPTNQTITIVASAPIATPQGETIGVLAGRAKMIQINNLLTQRIGMGATGETYLIAANYALMTNSRFPGSPAYQTYVRTSAANSAIGSQVGGIGEYNSYRRVPVLGVYRYIPELNAALLVEQELQESLGAQRLANNITIAAAVLTILLALAAAMWIAGSFTRPLAQLTRSANQIAAIAPSSSSEGRAGAGQYVSGQDALQGALLPVTTIAIQRQDEIGSLAGAFQAMTGELRGLVNSLEQRIAARTAELQVRSDQLLAASEVSSSIAALLEIDTLIQRVVDLIRQRFDLYYVGLFIVDETRQYAVLKAGTGQPGRAMLARGHRLKIGEGSMIGWSIANAQARIALQAGEDPVRLATPDLPDTRSEAALPLRSRGQVLGAITIQSARPGAFDPATIAIFQSLADQVAIAIDNARLFTETENALQTVRQAYGELSRQAWLQRLRHKPTGYRIDQQGVFPLAYADSSPTQPADAPRPAGAPSSTTRLPITARGQVIGYISAKKPLTETRTDGGAGASGSYAPTASVPEDNPLTGQWLPDEITLLENLADQLGIALDSARLFEETQQQAERQRLIGEITAHMRATLDIDTVLQTAAREMRQALELAEVEVRLGVPTTAGIPTTAGARSAEPGAAAANPKEEKNV